jgi:ribosome maturation protein Sdo1
VAIPTDLQTALENAEAALEAAQGQDSTVKSAQSQADQALASLATAQTTALDAHRVANQAATDFLTAAKVYFGQQSQVQP